LEGTPTRNHSKIYLYFRTDRIFSIPSNHLPQVLVQTYQRLLTLLFSVFQINLYYTLWLRSTFHPGEQDWQVKFYWQLAHAQFLYALL